MTGPHQLRAAEHILLHSGRPKDEPGPPFKLDTDFRKVIALWDFHRVLRRLLVCGTQHLELGMRGS